MAAELVGGAFLSASLQVLFQRLASEDLIAFLNADEPITRLLNDLKTKLLSANGVLNDAEEKQIRDPSVKQWLDQLKEAIYDSEDLAAQVHDLVSPFDKAGLKSRLSEILDRLGFIVEQKGFLGLREGVSPSHSSRLLSAGLADESAVFGRELDREAVVEMLLSGSEEPEVSVLSIVGMGGIGKTTVAQLVYDDPRLEERFDARAWVGVSDKLDVLRVTRTIYEAVTSTPCESRDLHSLQVKLKNALREKKFLIVLDDVWNENYVLWDVLRSPFRSGARGSKVVVTTRSEIVASKVSTGPTTYRLGIICDEACWALFVRHAFNGVDSSANSMLGVFGRQIVRKCKGLPLAIKSLGGLLRSVVDPEEWRKIAKSDVWELSERESNILPALWLSYHYLPPHLKRCFSYCSIFPKGYGITKEKLIMLWMAEGLLQEPTRNKRIEEVGNECFFDLLSRSLFQRCYHSSSFFKMHDLVNELAKFVSGKFCSRPDDHAISKKTRYLSYMKRSVNSIKKFEALFEGKCLRTFLPLGWMKKETQPFPWNDMLLHNLLPKLPCLRVLSLAEYPIMELPDSLGSMRHLRYLDLSWTKLKKLPSSFCSLYNLETLILAHCKYLTHLPSNMGNLTKLRYLDIECTAIKDMPQEIQKMNGLQALSNFVLGERSGSSIKQLRELKQLQGCLNISGLQNVVIEDVVEANLRDKKFIKRLHLKWDSGSHTDDSQKERTILDSLRPHKGLKELLIFWYKGTRFPDWIGSGHFANIQVMSLSNCRNCCLLPSLGQLPSLKKLDITGFDGVLRIGEEFYFDSSPVTAKPFRHLEVLRFRDMPEWQEWSFIGIEEGVPFSNLKELYMIDCPKLIRGLPNRLPNLTTMFLSRCQRLKISPQSDHHMDTAFPLLRSMEISDCTEFELFLLNHSELPSNLSELSIINCETLFASRTKWNLQKISSLRWLRIRSMYEDPMKLFPEEGLFPNTLAFLSISNLPNIEVFNGKGIQQLVTLKQLWISSCAKLRSLPEGLPKSLTYLFIFECPLLNQRCQRERGEDWPKISHVPRVRIDGEFI